DVPGLGRQPGEDAVEIPARRGHRPEGGDGRAEREVAVGCTGTADLDRADRSLEPLMDRVEAVAELDIVGVARTPAPVALERVVADREEIGRDPSDRCPGALQRAVDRSGRD